MPVKMENGVIGKGSSTFKLDPRFINVIDGWNPRKNFGDEDDIVLKKSIISSGVLTALRVKKNGDGYDLIDGERRLRAVMSAIDDGHDIVHVPCVLEKQNISMENALVKSLVSNHHKKLTPSERGEAYSRLVAWGKSPKKIEEEVGDSYTSIRICLDIHEGSQELKAAVDNREITQIEAREIVNTSGGDPDVMNRRLEEVKKNKEEKKERKKKEREEAKTNSTENTAPEEEPLDITDPVTEEDTTVTVSGTEDIEEPEVSDENEDTVAPVSDPDPVMEPTETPDPVSEPSPSSKKNKITMDREELESLLVGATWDYKNAKNEKEMVFAAGQIRTLCLILDMKEPVDTNI